jgi:ABC-type arginine/histidine transport system permease subunit
MPDEPDGGAHDWVSQITSRLTRLTDVLQNYSTRPALGIAQYLLIGAVSAIVGTAVVIAIVVSLTKLFDDDVFSGRVWATDFLFGGLIMLSGVLLFRKGVRRKEPTNE